jgi:hypothetical protein
VSDTIRLFIGTSPNGEDYEAEAVAAYTAQKFSSLPIEITWMRQSKIGPYSGWKSCRSGATPFSAFRWSPPAMCGFAGRAIYTDVDFVFHADLAELWSEEIPGVIVTKRPKPAGKIRTCCTLFDCVKAKGHVADLDGLRRMDDPQGHYSNYFKDRPELVSNYQSGEWNAHDTFDLSNQRIKATHYTRLEHQLHLRHAIPRLTAQGRSHWYTGEVFAHPIKALQDYFDAMLEEAKESGLTYESFGYGSGVEISRRNFRYTSHKGDAPIVLAEGVSQ